MYSFDQKVIPRRKIKERDTRNKRRHSFQFLREIREENGRDKEKRDSKWNIGIRSIYTWSHVRLSRVINTGVNCEQSAPISPD